MSDKLSAPRVVNIYDLRQLAQRRLPRAVFDYVDGGADYEVTLRENSRAFDDIFFRPRNAVGPGDPSFGTTLFGSKLALPMLLAPIGSCRLVHPRAEEAAVRAAGQMGIGYVLSTFAGTALEEVRQAASGPTWFQLYLGGTREMSLETIGRAKKAGYTVLVVTIDTAVSGYRVRDVRNGIRELIGRNPLDKLRFSGQILSRPRWMAGFYADGGLMKFPNMVVPGQGPMPYADVAATLAQSVVTWADLDWIREAWQGPILVKGITTADDAVRAADHGVDGVIVSNHGGRQLDGVPPAIRTLPEVVRAVGDRVVVLFDSGIRRGSDIAKALCLGAQAVLVGRAYVYGLAAGGSRGATRAIEILRDEFIRTMKLLGVSSLGQLNRSLIELPDSWSPAEGSAWAHVRERTDG